MPIILPPNDFTFFILPKKTTFLLQIFLKLVIVVNHFLVGNLLCVLLEKLPCGIKSWIIYNSWFVYFLALNGIY